MGKRIFSTVLLWLVILATMYFFQATGGIVLIVLVALFTQREFYQMVARMGHVPFSRIGLLLGVAITLAPVLVTEVHPLLTPQNLLAVATTVPSANSRSSAVLTSSSGTSSNSTASGVSSFVGKPQWPLSIASVSA